MFAEPAAPHHRPHFHAYYQDEVGVFAIDTIELIGGDLPQKQRRLVEAWAEIPTIVNDSTRLVRREVPKCRRRLQSEANSLGSRIPRSFATAAQVEEAW